MFEPHHPQHQLATTKRATSKQKMADNEESVKSKNQSSHSSFPSIHVNEVSSGGIVGVNTLHQTINNYGGKENEQVQITANDEKRLKSILQKKALEISSNLIVIPIMLQRDDPVEPVLVELKSGVDARKLDEQGHYNNRKDFEKIMATCKGNISQEDIFSEALTYAKTEAKQTLNRNLPKENYNEAFEDYVQRHGNIVALIGQAGIGKTTLAKQIVQLVLTKRLFPHNEYVFFVAFRNVVFNEKCSLFKLLMSGISSWTDSVDSDVLWIKKLKDNSEVVIIFDGLDEADTKEFSNTVKQCSISEKCYPVDFVKEIFVGNLLPRAKKLVTSRPRQFSDLHDKCKPHFVVHILGLNESSQKELGEQICQCDYPKVSQFLDDHPDVSASCFVPAKCFLIMGVLARSIKDGNVNIHSLTEIFVIALYCFVNTDHIRNEKIDVTFENEMNKLALLAWKGFLERKLIFTEVDIKNAKIAANVFEAFLHTFRDNSLAFNIMEGKKRSSFSHLIWQELFAALYLVFFESLKNFKLHLDKLTEPLWEVVSKFMFGLFRPSVEEQISDIFALNQTQEEDFKEKKKILFGKAVDLMKNIPFQKSPHPTLDFLQLCGWIQEAGSVELDDHIALHLPKEIKIGGKILPIDVTGLGYVLQKAKEPFTSKIETMADFTLSSQEMFLKRLADLNVKVSELDFDQMKFPPNSLKMLADAFKNLSVLKLENCGISSEDATIIGIKLNSLNEPMQQLSLRFNKIGDDGARGVAIGLSKLMALNLCDCDIGPSGAIAIGEKLGSLPHQMEKLDLSENRIGDEGISAIAGGLRNIKSFDVSYCDITSKGAEAIAAKLKALFQPMKELNLRGNFIGDNGAKSMADGIRNIEHVVLNCCNISTDAADFIKKRLTGLSTKVTGDDFSSDDDTTDSEED